MQWCSIVSYNLLLLAFNTRLNQMTIGEKLLSRNLVNFHDLDQRSFEQKKLPKECSLSIAEKVF